MQPSEPGRIQPTPNMPAHGRTPVVGWTNQKLNPNSSNLTAPPPRSPACAATSRRAAMNSIVEKNSNLPEIPRNEQIYARAERIMIRRHRPQREGMGRAESSLADLDAILPA